jgi:hypothetical protein
MFASVLAAWPASAQSGVGFGQGATDPRSASKGYQAPAANPQPPAVWGPQQATEGYRQQAPFRPTPAYQAPQSYAARPPTYVLAPPVLPYREGVETPNGYVLTSHRNQGLMIGGALVWAAAYGGGLIYAASHDFDNGTSWLAAPIVGPWAAISGRDFRCDSSNSPTQKEIDKCVDGALGEVTSITFLAVMGLVQAVGATLFFVGVGDMTKEWVRADLAGLEVEADAAPVGESGYGLRLRGAF